MLRKLTRPFIRAAKRMTGKPLTIDDISVITCRSDFDSNSDKKAVRQFNDNYWKIRLYAANTYTLRKGLTLSDALDHMERSDSSQSYDEISYNHVSKVREMLSAEDKTTPASSGPLPVTAVSPVPTAMSMETQKEVAIKSPFKLVIKHPLKALN